MVLVVALMEDLILWRVSVDCRFLDCSGSILWLSRWFHSIFLVVGWCFVLCFRREVRLGEYEK